MPRLHCICQEPVDFLIPWSGRRGTRASLLPLWVSGKPSRPRPGPAFRGPGRAPGCLSHGDSHAGQRRGAWGAEGICLPPYPLSWELRLIQCWERAAGIRLHRQGWGGHAWLCAWSAGAAWKHRGLARSSWWRLHHLPLKDNRRTHTLNVRSPSEFTWSKSRAVFVWLQNLRIPTVCGDTGRGSRSGQPLLLESSGMRTSLGGEVCTTLAPVSGKAWWPLPHLACFGGE